MSVIQITAIIGLLMAFGVPQLTVNRVQGILEATSTTSTVQVATTTVSLSISQTGIEIDSKIPLDIYSTQIETLTQDGYWITKYSIGPDTTQYYKASENSDGTYSYGWEFQKSMDELGINSDMRTKIILAPLNGETLNSSVFFFNTIPLTYTAGLNTLSLSF